MGLTALQPHSEPKTTPRSTEWCEIGQPSACHTVVPFARAIASSVKLARQITFRNKIPTVGVLRRHRSQGLPEIGRRLGLKPIFVNTHWETVLKKMQDGRYDCIVGGATITSERERVLAWSVPYVTVLKHLSRRAYPNISAVEKIG
jgi:hypothetical protein